MKRNTLNFWIDLISLLAMFALLLTGLLIHYILPPGFGGRGGGEGLTLWGLGRHDYGDIHFYLALALLALMLLHVWLHWPWVCATITNLLCRKHETPSRKKPRVIAGFMFLSLLILLTILALLFAKSQVQSAPGISPSHDEHTLSPDLTQLGQKSLAQLSELTGVPIETFIEGLNLPPDVDPDERLGRLRKIYNFDMDTVHTLALYNSHSIN
jgi:hypothetical protein